MNGYEDLANAIVLQAVNNYRLARKKRESENQAVLVPFFRSKWFAMLTNIDGRLLEQKLKEEY